MLSLFFKKVLLLILPFVGILWYLEQKLTQMPNTYNQKKKHLEAGVDSIDLLVLGSSQAFYGINPDFLKPYKGFNLAGSSQPFFFDKAFVDAYLPRLPKLKKVLISVSYFSFWYDTEDGTEAWRDYYYYQFWDFRKAHVQPFHKKAASKILLYSPRTAYKRWWEDFQIPEKDLPTPNGWYKVRLDAPVWWEVSDKGGEGRVREHEKIMRPERLAYNQALLDSILSKLQQRGVEAILITPPVLPFYHKYQTPALEAKNLEIIRAFQQKYGIRYFDYSRDARFERGEFRDNDHLNYLGAEKFSQFIAQEVLVNL